MTNKAARYTHGSIGGTMIKTAISMIPATLAISGYNIADTYFVSKLGTDPLAAMGFTFPMIMLIGCIYRGIAVGAATPLSHSIGSLKPGKAAKVATSGLILVLLCSIILGGIGLLTSKWVFSQFGANEQVMPMVLSYMTIWYIGNFTVSLSMTCNDFLIAAGATRSASTMMVSGMVLNLILDPMFIFGFGPIPAMGIAGAATATVIAQIFAGIVLLVILHQKYHLLTFSAFHWRLMKSSWKLITRIAIPAIIGMLMMPVGNAVITRIVAAYGNKVVAACAAAGRLEMVAFIVPMSLGMSLIPMIGQNFGGGHLERINQCRRFSMRFAGFFELGIAGIFFFAAPFLSSLFSKDPEVVKIMTIYLRIIPWGFGMMEIHRYCGFVYTGCNKPAMAAWLNALRLIGLLIPLSLLAMKLNSLNGLFIARLASDILAGAIGMLLVRRMTLTLLAQGTPQSRNLEKNSANAQIKEMEHA